MMKNKRKLIIIAMMAFMILSNAACFTTDKRQSFVFVIDMSASTDAEGRAKAFQAVTNWFAQKKLKRGDKLTIIPITGDAWTESQGLIKRFSINEKREAYDADLRKLEVDVKQQLEQMERAAAENPYKSTDIFGALKLAAEEFKKVDENTKKTLIVLSDLIQDDVTNNFKTVAFLESKNAALSQAEKLAEERPNTFADCTVFLGLLRSSDLKTMSKKRREALEVFWVEYFRQVKAAEVITAVDGPGQVESLLRDSA